jgi:hypothetical protein
MASSKKQKKIKELEYTAATAVPSTPVEVTPVPEPRLMTAPVEEPVITKAPIQPEMKFYERTEGSIMFLIGDVEVLKFCPNGKIYVRGELMEKNWTVYQQFKDWLAATMKGA